MAVDANGTDTTEGGSAAAVFRAEAGSLYVVATPLGNLRDLTLRARDVLATADAIAAEDTRTTATLLRHYGIATRMLSLHSHNEAQRMDSIAALLGAGNSVALVSDAGTPAISDPGARLVRAMRDAGFPVIPIPGPSAVVAAVSAAGLDGDAFLFAGFLPSQGKARRERLLALAPLPVALVFYEAPHRVRSAVDDLLAVLGPDRILVVRARTDENVRDHRADVPRRGARMDRGRHPSRARRIRADRRRAGSGDAQYSGRAAPGRRTLANRVAGRIAAGAGRADRGIGVGCCARRRLRARIDSQGGVTEKRLVASSSSTGSTRWFTRRQRQRTMPSFGLLFATRWSSTSTSRRSSSPARTGFSHFR